MGYTKLFSEIVASTIWREDDKTRLVWITMLAMKNERHMVEASVPGLADLARVTVDECRAAIIKLESPDEDSRNQEFGGRRIEKRDGGWFILNGEHYRKKMSLEERREYQRDYQRDYRNGIRRTKNAGGGTQAERLHEEGVNEGTVDLGSGQEMAIKISDGGKLYTGKANPKRRRGTVVIAPEHRNNAPLPGDDLEAPSI